MAITSESTQAQVLAQYNDNLDWDNSPAKAALALAAIRWLLINRPLTISMSARTVNYAALEQEKKLLENYIASTASMTTRCSFVRARAKQY